MQAVVNNLLVSYNQLGSGKKTILCLHGWADQSETFRKLIGELTNNYSILTIDLPGFGGSQAPPKAWSIPEYSDFVNKFLVKIKLEPYAVVGHSNGGAIAIYGVASRHIYPKKLILLASSGLRAQDSAKKKVYKVLAKSAKLVLMPLPKSLQKKIKKRAYTQIGSDLFAAENMRGTFERVVNYDVRLEAKSINTSTLLLYGQRDRITPISQGRVLSELIKNSKFEVVEGASHFLHQEQPAFIAKRIKEFLR